MAKKKKEIKDDYIQLDLIPPTELEKLYAEFKEVKESSDKVRRGVFAKATDLAKKVDVLTCEIDSLKAQLVTMTSWILTQLGAVESVQYLTEESQETTSLHITMESVKFADKLHRSHGQEITDIQNLIA